MKEDGKDIEGDRCKRGKDRRLGFSKRQEKIMEKSNGGDHE